MDLDDEEFKATRILNGVDKENIIEEDIKNIKELIKCAKYYRKYEGNKYYKSMENLLSEYTRQKQINEEYKKNNKELIKTINIVEKEKSDWIKAYQEEKDKQFNILRDSIPKKIKNIDIENKKFEIKIGGRENGNRIYNSIKLLDYIDSLPLNKMYGIQRISKVITVLTKDEVVLTQKIKDKIKILEMEEDYDYLDNKKVIEVLKELLEDK